MRTTEERETDRQLGRYRDFLKKFQRAALQLEVLETRVNSVSPQATDADMVTVRDRKTGNLKRAKNGDLAKVHLLYQRQHNPRAKEDAISELIDFRTKFQSIKAEGQTLEKSVRDELRGELKGKQLDVCEAYYCQCMTYEGISLLLGISKSRAWQLHDESLRELTRRKKEQKTA